MSKKCLIKDWQQAKQLVDSCLQQQHLELLSLDIFDTLLERIDAPEQVQRHVCRHLAGFLGQGLHPDRVWEARQQAEQKLRDEALQAGRDYECRFSDLVPSWLDALSQEGNAEQTAEVLRLELKAEKLALRVKSGVIDFLDWVQQQEITLLAISDMYLDGVWVRELLADKGLLDYFQSVFVSADSLLCKYSGRLYEQIHQEYPVSKAHWLHIGDNDRSDAQAACQLGIQGIWLYEKAAMQQREQLSLAARMAQLGSIWRGRHFFSLVERIQQEPCRSQVRDLPPLLLDNPLAFYQNYGRDVLGPAYSTFMLGLKERLQRQSFKKIFFIARDGYLFQQMYPQLDLPVPSVYIYLSRKVITAAAVAEGLSLEQAQVAFYNPKQQGLLSICRVYGLSADVLEPLAKQYGFSDFDAAITDWQDQRLLDFLADEAVQAHVCQSGQRNRDLLERYLQQEGFLGGEHVALVDIGWNGTVQKFLKQAFGQRADFPIVNAYYFAFVPKMYADFGKNNFSEGIIHDTRRDNACERIPSEFEEIFEQGARSPEATTLGYHIQNGRLEPVLKAENTPDRRAEAACNPAIAALQTGVMEHWQHFQGVQALTAYKSTDLLPYVHGLLERAVVYPTREEIEHLTQLVHTEDFGHDHVLELGKRALNGWDFVRPRQLWQHLRVAAWRYALLVNIPTHFANFAARMWYLHAVKK